MSTITLDTSYPPDIPAKPTYEQKRSETTELNKDRDYDNSNKNNNNNENVTTSLSFDQVNDNADELIELRGEGRYFGVTDPTSGKTINSLQNLGPLCANCHKRGHIRSKCKTVICHKCGVVGDHYETQCPTTMICSKCGLKGHIASNCTNKQKKREYCKLCDTFSHGDDRCPNIWRSYLTLPISKDEQDLETVLPIIYCYNCGDDTHYGDECDEARSSRVPNQTGSAFSGSNLPRHLRDIYYKRIKQVRKPASYGGGYNNYNNNSNYNGNYNNNYNGNSNNQNSRYGGNNSKSSSRNGYSDFSNKKKPFNGGTSKFNKDFVKRPSPSDSGVHKPSRSGVLLNKSKKKNDLIPNHTPFNSPYNEGKKAPQAPTRLGMLLSRRPDGKGKSEKSKKKSKLNVVPNY